MSPIVRIKDLKKSFGRLEALKGLNLEIPEGIIYGLIGPNGSGKTTLIRIILGISPPSAGEVWVLGSLMPNRAVHKLIGYMPQAESLYKELTLDENLAFFARIYGLWGKNLSQRIDKALELVGLSARRKDLIEELSGGMRRRASLACALLPEPKILVLDEPTVGVDPELRIQFWEHFERLAKEGISILVSTHHLDEAWRCQRLGLLREGELLKEGSPDQLSREANAKSLEETFLYFARGLGE